MYDSLLLSLTIFCWTRFLNFCKVKTLDGAASIEAQYAPVVSFTQTWRTETAGIVQNNYYARLRGNHQHFLHLIDLSKEHLTPVVCAVALKIARMASRWPDELSINFVSIQIVSPTSVGCSVCLFYLLPHSSIFRQSVCPVIVTYITIAGLSYCPSTN